MYHILNLLRYSVQARKAIGARCPVVEQKKAPEEPGYNDVMM